MPKDLLVHAAQAYMTQPDIHMGYKTKKGGVGTVMANIIAVAKDMAHAKTSTVNLKG